MGDKDKAKPAQPKHVPKDGQVIIAIMKEMGIKEYEPKTVVQLTEFVYRYATSILEEARMYANNSKKRFLDVDDVRLALQLTSESTFTTPPPREVLLELAHTKNYSALPPVKPHCGLRLPPDRYCLSSCNYTLKSFKKQSYIVQGCQGLKLTPKTNVSFLKRTSPMIGKQTVSIPKPMTKISNPNMVLGAGSPGQFQKTVLKPKIQITQNVQIAPANTGMGGSNINIVEYDSNLLKRKREDEPEMS
ncbi:unnamed protein product [Acanthoscelides obtectus]|uniref:Transcription initiation factor TFIID subunit 9 n=1 Tax=Acanthoscelides obtectus TaxID=200917 RepID=A0A9P0KEM3_ACAOB|nr:unnamed protein product [Acanthoscelides obtectus]CAK1638597.1 Transcription initiation factor TFIID subunit 9 [Acanthoscelides obtectus]